MIRRIGVSSTSKSNDSKYGIFFQLKNNDSCPIELEFPPSRRIIIRRIEVSSNRKIILKRWGLGPNNSAWRVWGRGCIKARQNMSVTRISDS